MLHLPQMPGKPRNRKAVLSLTLVFLLLLAPAALAIKYRPTRPSAPKGNTTPTGVRGGCDATAKAGLTALAPIGHIGQTISTRPTIAWFAPDKKSYPMKVRLYQQKAGNRWTQVGKDIPVPPGNSQMRQLTLTQELTIGQIYAWQVVVDCVPGYPSARLVAEAQIQVVNASADLKAKLVTARNASDRADLYASADLWYDASAEVFNSTQKLDAGALLNELVETERSRLKELENQNSTEAQRQSRALRRQIEHLTQIIEIEQQRASSKP